MDIDLGQDLKFNVKYNGNVYVLREPTVKETMGLKEKVAEDQNAVVNFMEMIGLPREIAEAMPISKIKLLVDTVVGALSEKK